MKYSFTLIVLLTALLCLAQKTRPVVLYEKALSVSPFSLIDPYDRSLTLTGEYRKKESLGFLTEAGFIFASGYLRESDKARGFQVKPAVRFYYGRRLNTYIQIQALYKQVTYRMNDWLGKDCVNAVPAYEHLQQFKFRKKVLGMNAVSGVVWPLSRKWHFELYGGLGWRYKTQGVIDEVNSCYNFQPGFIDNIYNDKVTSISVPAGIKIMFAFR